MDDVTALRDALVERLTSDWDMDPWGEYEASKRRLEADLDALIAAVEARAARRALEGSGVVEAVEATRSLPEDAPNWRTDKANLYAAGWIDRGDAIRAALPHPEEPRVLCWYPGCTATPETHGLSVCIGGGTCASHHPFTPEVR